MNLKDSLRSVFKLRIFECLIQYHNHNKIYGKGFTKLTPNHYSYKKESFRFTRRSEINYKLDISNLVDWYIYFGFKEPEKVKFFSLISNGQTIVDVGANIGDMALNFAKLVGEKGKVISFEPFPPMFSTLTNNISLNTFKNIETYNLGLANEEGIAEMEEPILGNPGMNRITSNSTKKTTQIKVVRLDDFLTENNIEQIDAIKIDVEGFEHEVILGAQKSIRKFLPILFVELDDDNLKEQNSSAKKIIQVLLDYGYSIENASTNEKVTQNTDFTHCHFDILCIHSTKLKN